MIHQALVTGGLEQYAPRTHGSDRHSHGEANVVSGSSGAQPDSEPCSKRLHPRSCQSLTTTDRRIAHDLLARVLERGQMDVIADFASPLPAIITSAMLGVCRMIESRLPLWPFPILRVGQQIRSKVRYVASDPSYQSRALRKSSRMSRSYSGRWLSTSIPIGYNLFNSLRTPQDCVDLANSLNP